MNIQIQSVARAWFVAAAALAALGAPGVMWNGFRAPAKAAVEHEKGYLWLEAEEFSDYGSWVIDTQFVGKMGSAYLLGAGVTGCCANATGAWPAPGASARMRARRGFAST